MINLGTDIDSEWDFINGDLILAKDLGNLNQAIINRLKADIDFYSIFYRKYGGKLSNHLGDLNHSTIRDYIKIEVEDILSQEPRINYIECSVDKINSNSVSCNLFITLYDNSTSTDLNLVLSSDNSILISENTEYSEET